MISLLATLVCRFLERIGWKKKEDYDYETEEEYSQIRGL